MKRKRKAKERKKGNEKREEREREGRKERRIERVLQCDAKRHKTETQHFNFKMSLSSSLFLLKVKWLCSLFLYDCLCQR